MLEVGGIILNTDVEDIISLVQEETMYFKDLNELEKDYMVTCAFHKGGMEDKPSLGINKDTGVYHCFTCGERGDILQLLQHTLELSKNQVIRKLAGEYIYSSNSRRIDVDFNKPQEIPKIMYGDIKPLLDNNRKALAYLATRGIQPIVAKYFPIGYYPNNGTIRFYIQDTQGNFIYHKERAIKHKMFFNQSNIKKSNYLYGARQLLRYWDRTSPVWVCESEIDCLTCWSRGCFAVAIGGSHISKKQIAILQSLGVRQLIDGMDRDVAGREGWESIKSLVHNMITYDTIFPNNKKDINDLTSTEFNNIKICKNLQNIVDR